MKGLSVVRPDDMHPNRALKVRVGDGGDVHVMITENSITVGGVDVGNAVTCPATLEFCMKGGRSPNTLQALRGLMEAMEKDNAERPIR